MRTPATLFAAIAMLALTAQSVPQVHRIAGAFDAFTTDELGHVYTLRGDVLELHDTKGKRIARNSLKTFGRISTIDAFYSLKPMVFSRDQRQIAVLDNTLSVQGSVIDLPRNGFPWVSLACAGVQNTFWFFDERELQLTRVDNQLRPLASTGRLDQLLGHSPQPTQLLESNNLLYVNDPAHGVLVFDLFGAWMRTLPVVGAQRIQVRDGSVFFFKDGVLLSYDLLSFEIRPLDGLTDAQAIDARVEGGLIHVLTADGVVVAPLPVQ